MVGKIISEIPSLVFGLTFFDHMCFPAQVLKGHTDVTRCSSSKSPDFWSKNVDDKLIYLNYDSVVTAGILTNHVTFL